MLSCTINTADNRYVVGSDIPFAFLNADMSENIHMLLEGTIAKMIVKFDSKIYRKQLWYAKHGTPIYTYNSKISIQHTTSGTTFNYYTQHYSSGVSN